MGYEQIEGWMNFEDVYDEAVARAVDGDVLVEVGVANGRSLMYLAGRAIAYGRKVEVIGVDQWKSERDYERIMAEMAAACPEEFRYAKTIRATSLDAAVTFRDASLAFVFIDADHHYEDVRADIRAWTPKVRAGGMLAGHDFSTADWPSVVKAVNDELGPQTPIGRASYCWGITVTR